MRLSVIVLHVLVGFLQCEGSRQDNARLPLSIRQNSHSTLDGPANTTAEPHVPRHNIRSKKLFPNIPHSCSNSDLGSDTATRPSNSSNSNLSKRSNQGLLGPLLSFEPILDAGLVSSTTSYGSEWSVPGTFFTSFRLDLYRYLIENDLTNFKLLPDEFDSVVTTIIRYRACSAESERRVLECSRIFLEDGDRIQNLILAENEILYEVTAALEQPGNQLESHAVDLNLIQGNFSQDFSYTDNSSHSLRVSVALQGDVFFDDFWNSLAWALGPMDEARYQQFSEKPALNMSFIQAKKQPWLRTPFYKFTGQDDLATSLFEFRLEMFDRVRLPSSSNSTMVVDALEPGDTEPRTMSNTSGKHNSVSQAIPSTVQKRFASVPEIESNGLRSNRPILEPREFSTTQSLSSRLRPQPTKTPLQNLWKRWCSCLAQNPQGIDELEPESFLDFSDHV